MLARAKPLAAPLTITGLSPKLGTALQEAAAKRGRMVLAAPAGPLGSFPVQTLRPGSAFGVGYASGDLSASAIGTVTYTDGDQVWGFGHPLEGVGARALLLQDAYVFRVVNNPLAIPGIAGTYKYAATGHDLGDADQRRAVRGRRARRRAAHDDPGAHVRDRSRHWHEALAHHERGGRGGGRPADRHLGPLAHGAARGRPRRPGRSSAARPRGSPAAACYAITFKQRKKPARFCNRYVTDVADPLGAGNVVAAAAGADLLSAIALVDAYKASELQVTGVEANLKIQRGQRQAYLQRVRAAAPRARRAHGAGARSRCATSAGRLERRKVRAAAARRPAAGQPARRLHRRGRRLRRGRPRGAVRHLRPGVRPRQPRRRPRARATCASSSAQIEGLARYDGVSARRPSDDPDDFDPGEPSYRDPGAAHLRLRRARASASSAERRAQLRVHQRVGGQRRRVAAASRARARGAACPTSAPSVLARGRGRRRCRRRAASRRESSSAPRRAQPGEVPAAVERRAEHEVAPGAQVGQRRVGVRRAEPRAPGAGDEQRPAPDLRDRLVEVARRDQRDARGKQRRDRVAVRASSPRAGAGVAPRQRRSRPRRRRRAAGARRRGAGRGRRRPRRGAPDQQRLERGGALGAELRREARERGRVVRRAGERRARSRRSLLVEAVHDARRREGGVVDARERRLEQPGERRRCWRRSARAGARPASPRPGRRSRSPSRSRRARTAARPRRRARSRARRSGRPP